MRRILRDVERRAVADHVGLAYERWAPVGPGGKLLEGEAAEWLTRLAATPVSTDYRAHYQRWAASFDADGSRTAEVTLASRLLIGHGNPAGSDVGLTLHHTWGVPIVPGSAVKGLLSHYLHACYAMDTPGPHPMDPALDETVRQRAAFQRPLWEHRKVVHGPGDVQRAIFGAPSAADDKQFAAQGAGETAGEVIFHDALYVPVGSERPFAVDVLTPHQRRYYSAKLGDVPPLPSDYDRPNPVTFLSVRPGTRFLVALSGPAEWTDFTLRFILESLSEWGVGAKTAAGYAISDRKESRSRPNPSSRLHPYHLFSPRFATG